MFKILTKVGKNDCFNVFLCAVVNLLIVLKRGATDLALTLLRNILLLLRLLVVQRSSNSIFYAVGGVFGT